MKRIVKYLQAAGILTVALAASPLLAADGAEQHISIKNRMFEPKELHVPTGEKIKIVVKNEDTDAAEFESLKLNREKVVPAKDEVTVYVGPLDPGAYPFFNDFDPNKASGTIIAK